MKKITWNLFLIFLMGVLCAGTLGANQAQATGLDGPVLEQPEGGDPYLEAPCEADDGPDGGSEGDPDSAGDGLGFMGDILDILGGLYEGLTFEELIEIWFGEYFPTI